MLLLPAAVALLLPGVVLLLPAVVRVSGGGLPGMLLTLDARIDLQTYQANSRATDYVVRNTRATHRSRITGTP